MQEKEYVFYFHFNKIAARKTGKVSWTIHFKNKCHNADFIQANIPVFTFNRNDQPYAVVKGKVKESQFKIIGGICYLGDFD